MSREFNDFCNKYSPVCEYCYYNVTTEEELNEGLCFCRINQKRYGLFDACHVDKEIKQEQKLEEKRKELENKRGKNE